MRTGQLVDNLRRRWAVAGFPDYPTWIPLLMDGAAAAAAVGAVVQRIGEHPLVPVTALMGLAITPWIVGLLGVKLPWPVFTGVVLAGTTAVIVLFPVEYDFGLLLLVMMAGHIGATESLVHSAAATAVAGAVLVVLDRMGEFSGSKFWFAALVVGWDVGYIMQHQQRALEDQRRNQAAREQQVVLEERQRIAREVHDVVAHSLSVTMLHLTAARRDLEEEGAVDVGEAVEALRDAERIGRQAMTDIRRTVGILGAPGPATVSPAPGLEEVPALVEEFREAGLDVVVDRLEVAGREDVPAPVALGVYRVLQESLANVAKHQPRANVHVALGRVDGALALTVSNDLAGGAPREPDGLGSGLRGMRERAELLGGTLSAGREGRSWRVRLEVPLADCGPGEPKHQGTNHCPLGVSRRPLGELT